MSPRNVLGIDTSNYTTSAAVYDGTEVACFAAKLLPVAKGEYGIRQNDAVFHHTAALPEVIGSVVRDAAPPVAVGVSSAPRLEENSYMPCFTAGISAAKIISGILKIPLYTFSHQQGHIAAAAYGAKRLDLLNERFIAFHLSGGTTEAVLVFPDKDAVIKTKLIAKSLDLKAGQAVDRVGKLLSIGFPAGTALEEMARNGISPMKPRPCLKGADCCLSGLYNLCENLFDGKAKKQDVARFCIDYICETLCEMTAALLETYGDMPLLYAGGVMSNGIIKDKITERFGGFFAPPEYSRDNAAGTAILASIVHSTATAGKGTD